MKYYKTIIFDFDGTIADSYIITFRIYNELAEKYNLKSIPEADISILRTMKPFELLSYFQIPFHKIPFLLFEGRSLFKKYVHELEPISGMKEVLEQLSKKYKLGILTSNNAENVEYFLKKHKLELFAFIHSEKNLFGKDKALNHLLEEHNLEKSKTIYVGDEVRDIQSCQKIDMSIISVAWGFNEVGILGKHNPSYLIQHPEELLNIL